MELMFVLLTLVPKALGNLCAGVQSVVLAHPKYCKKFIICEQGQSSEFVCPGDLYFDDIIKSCILHSLAHCAPTLPPPTPTIPLLYLSTKSSLPISSTEYETLPPISTTTPFSIDAWKPLPPLPENLTTTEPKASPLPPISSNKTPPSQTKFTTLSTNNIHSKFTPSNYTFPTSSNTLVPSRESTSFSDTFAFTLPSSKHSIFSNFTTEVIAKSNSTLLTQPIFNESTTAFSTSSSGSIYSNTNSEATFSSFSYSTVNPITLKDIESSPYTIILLPSKTSMQTKTSANNSRTTSSLPLSSSSLSTHELSINTESLASTLKTPSDSSKSNELTSLSSIDTNPASSLNANDRIIPTVPTIIDLQESSLRPITLVTSDISGETYFSDESGNSYSTNSSFTSVVTDSPLSISSTNLNYQLSSLRPITSIRTNISSQTLSSTQMTEGTSPSELNKTSRDFSTVPLNTFPSTSFNTTNSINTRSLMLSTTKKPKTVVETTKILSTFVDTIPSYSLSTDAAETEISSSTLNLPSFNGTSTSQSILMSSITRASSIYVTTPRYFTLSIPRTSKSELTSSIQNTNQNSDEINTYDTTANETLIVLNFTNNTSSKNAHIDKTLSLKTIDVTLKITPPSTTPSSEKISVNPELSSDVTTAIRTTVLMNNSNKLHLSSQSKWNSPTKINRVISTFESTTETSFNSSEVSPSSPPYFNTSKLPLQFSAQTTSNTDTTEEKTQSISLTSKTTASSRSAQNISLISTNIETTPLITTEWHTRSKDIPLMQYSSTIMSELYNHQTSSSSLILKTTDHYNNVKSKSSTMSNSPADITTLTDINNNKTETKINTDPKFITEYLISGKPSSPLTKIPLTAIMTSSSSKKSTPFSTTNFNEINSSYYTTPTTSTLLLANITPSHRLETNSSQKMWNLTSHVSTTANIPFDYSTEITKFPYHNESMLLKSTILSTKLVNKLSSFTPTTKSSLSTLQLNTTTMPTQTISSITTSSTTKSTTFITPTMPPEPISLPPLTETTVLPLSLPPISTKLKTNLSTIPFENTSSTTKIKTIASKVMKTMETTNSFELKPLPPLTNTEAELSPLPPLLSISSTQPPQGTSILPPSTIIPSSSSLPPSTTHSQPSSLPSPSTTLPPTITLPPSTTFPPSTTLPLSITMLPSTSLPPSKPASTTLQSTTPPPYTTVLKSTILPPCDPYKAYTLANPVNTRTFYYCVYGTSYIFSCPYNYKFNPIKHICTHPEDCECEQTKE